MQLCHRHNQERIDDLEKEREEYMFTVDQLCQLMDTTPSVKTKLAFVDLLAPRILNPKDASKVSEVFPYATEKATVKDLLSARATVSYTHLRAHETRHDLVCRLLLEKKK